MRGLRISLGGSRELEEGIPVAELPYAWVLVVAGTALGAWLTGSQSRLSVMLGAPFLLLGGLLAVATVRTLGRAQYLVTVGPYRWVRHPYYLAILVMLVGAVIALRTWPGAVLLIPAVLVTVDRARREEHNLAIRFSEQFEDYRRQVPFLLPFKPPLKAPIATSEPTDTPAESHVDAGEEVTRASEVEAPPDSAPPR